MREERRLVTALFADIIGSTAITARHGAEEARLIVGEAVSRAVRIVESYGGTVKDLAGDGMLALFGAPIAHEDDAERALRAGIDIVETIRGYAEEVKAGWGIDDFGVRLGADTGDVVVGQIGAGSRVEYGATGDAVNIAARLQSHAPPGRIVATLRTARLAGSSFGWAAERSLQLKGIDEPVQAADLIGLSEDRVLEEARASLVGRDGELESARRALDLVGKGGAAIVFVGGDPGIGKTRLCSEVRRMATSTGALWLEGRCASYATNLAWWPIRDLLQGWIGVTSQDPELRRRLALRRRLEELLPTRAADIQPFLSTVLGFTPDADTLAVTSGLSPESLQFRTCQVLGEVVEALAERSPVAIYIDDLHWADATSLAMLRELMAAVEDVPVLVLLNHRLETAHSSWMLREHAQREFRHLTTVIDLDPLAGPDEERLLASLTDGAMDAQVRQRILSYAEGNPLYLEELAMSVRHSEDSAAVPVTLEGVILSRLDRLDAGARDVLTAASVCGRTFPIALLAQVSGATENDLQEPLHDLRRQDLLYQEGRGSSRTYVFKHVLIQEAAYRTLTAARRRDLHDRAARWLEQESSPPGLLAHHWLGAENADKATGYLREAGQLAMREWALDDAATHFRSLVDVLRSSGREQDAARPLFQLAATLNLAMRFREANEAWREAFSLWREPVAAPEQTATLVVGTTQMPWNMDPFAGGFVSNLRVTMQLNDPLFVLRPGPCLEPGLARSLEVTADGVEYVVRLREGLTFNSGKPFTADSVVESIVTVLRTSNGDGDELSMVKGAEALMRGDTSAELGVTAEDAHSVRFSLNQPTPHFPFILTYSHFGGAVSGDFTGAFRLVDAARDRVVVETEPSYPRHRRGNVRRVEWRPVDDQREAKIMESREVDILLQVRDLRRLEEVQGVKEVSDALAFGQYLVATSGGPLVDQPLRSALALATDRSRLQQGRRAQQIVATGGVVPPGLIGHTPGIAPAFDPDQARAYLAQSAHQGPLRVAHFEGQAEAFVDILDCWREVLGLEVVEDVVHMRELRELARDHHVVQGNWAAGLPDPDYFLSGLFQSTSRNNYWNNADPEVDALLARMSATRSGTERLALAHEADHLIVAVKCLAIPLFYATVSLVVQDWVHGWWEWVNATQLYSELHVGPSSPRSAQAAT